MTFTLPPEVTKQSRTDIYRVSHIINCCSHSILTSPFAFTLFSNWNQVAPLSLPLSTLRSLFCTAENQRQPERDGGWKEKNGGRERGKMSLQTELATLFFSRGNSLKLKLNLKLMKHILAVAFVSEVINYLYQPRRQRFLSVN